MPSSKGVGNVGLFGPAVVGQPGVGQLVLHAIREGLVEQAEVVTQAHAVAGQVEGGQRIQEAGGQAAQTAVAQAGIGFLIVNGIDLDVGIRQHALGHFVQPQVEQAGTQAAAHQEFHAEVVDLLFALAQHFGLELLLAVRHDLAGDRSQAAIDLVGGSSIQGDIALAGQLIFQELLKLTLCVFQIVLS